MATRIVMEALSPTMEEGRLVEWKKKEGDPVAVGDVIAEVETDKAVMELVARAGGVLLRQLVPAGATVPVSQPVGWIGAAGGGGGGGGGGGPAPAGWGRPAPPGGCGSRWAGWARRERAWTGGAGAVRRKGGKADRRAVRREGGQAVRRAGPRRARRCLHRPPFRPTAFPPESRPPPSPERSRRSAVWTSPW